MLEWIGRYAAAGRKRTPYAAVTEAVSLMESAARGSNPACPSEPPSAARDCLLVVPIDLAELSLKITLLAKDHAEMEDQQRRHHQENNPIRGEHDTEAEQREAAALIGRVSNMGERARSDERSGRLIGPDIGAGSFEG